MHQTVLVRRSSRGKSEEEPAGACTSGCALSAWSHSEQQQRHGTGPRPVRRPSFVRLSPRTHDCAGSPMAIVEQRFVPLSPPMRGIVLTGHRP